VEPVDSLSLPLPILTEEERCGTLLAGKYRIESILGRGGMGVVFRASHVHTGRQVALKILRPELSRDEQLGKRFVREARAATMLRHPNVVEVLDLGVEADGTVYQVLELLEGEALRDLLDRKGRLSPERALEILLPVMDALVHAHAQGIVHRDLKPDNIFLADARNARMTPTLLDFGIAKILDRQGSLATHTGSVMGTPQYMAPEQARGAREQGPSIDVWAMGIIAFECLAGDVPFEGATPALVMVRIMTERAPRLDTVVPDIPAGLADAIEAALRPAPEERHASMKAFVAALRQAATAAGIPLPPEHEATATPASVRPPRTTVRLGGAASASAETEVPVSIVDGELLPTVHSSAAASVPSVRERKVDTSAPTGVGDRSPTPVATEVRPRWPLAALIAVGLLALAGGGAALIALRQTEVVETPAATAPDAVHVAPVPPPAAEPAPSEPVAEASPEPLLTATTPPPEAQPTSTALDTDATARPRARRRTQAAEATASPPPRERPARSPERTNGLPGMAEW
jgi:serine/threonine-protein kinase